MLTSSATPDAADAGRFSAVCDQLLAHKSQIIAAVDLELTSAGLEPPVEVTGTIQPHALVMDSFLTRLKAGQECRLISHQIASF